MARSVRRQILLRLLETEKATRWIPHNSREGLKEALADVEEGADIIMVKPAHVLSGHGFGSVKGRSQMYRLPHTVSAVSMQWSKQQLQTGWIDEERIVCEMASRCITVQVRRSILPIMRKNFWQDLWMKGESADDEDQNSYLSVRSKESREA